MALDGQPGSLPVVHELDPARYQVWESQLLAFSRAVHPDRPPNGLAALVVTREQYLRLDGAEQHFRLLEDAQTRDANTRAVHDAYLTEQRAITALRTKIFATVPPGILALHADFDHGSTNGCQAIGTEALLTWLRNRYSRATPADYDAAVAALTRPYDGRRMDQFIGEMFPHFAVAATAGQPFSEFQRIRFLMQAVSANDPYGAFRQATFEYQRTHPNINGQRFSDYGEVVYNTWLATESVQNLPPVAANPYAPTSSASTATSTAQPIAAGISVEQLASALAAAVASKSLPPPPDKMSYCRFHGQGNHGTQDCRKLAKRRQAPLPRNSRGDGK